MGNRPAMLPEHHDADRTTATLRTHGLPQKVRRLKFARASSCLMFVCVRLHVLWSLVCTSYSCSWLLASLAVHILVYLQHSCCSGKKLHSCRGTPVTHAAAAVSCSCSCVLLFSAATALSQDSRHPVNL